MKTSELAGAALDWAVALIEYPEWKDQGYLEVFPHDLSFDDGTTYAPSTDWAQGGPIIERECMEFDYEEASQIYHAYNGIHGAQGKTHLIAAMRCYVASKLGDEVEIPKELLI